MISKADIRRDVLEEIAGFENDGQKVGALVTMLVDSRGTCDYLRDQRADAQREVRRLKELLSELHGPLQEPAFDPIADEAPKVQI